MLLITPEVLPEALHGLGALETHISSPVELDEQTTAA
jgi:hypothetical protein